MKARREVKECTPKKGDWVLFKGNRIIACNSNPKIIYEIAQKYDTEEVVIAKEPSSIYCYY